MRIICCYTNLHPKTKASVERYAPTAEFIETPGLFSYNEVIGHYWDGSDDLVVIEQDKEITAEVIPSFAVCPKPWCMYSYIASPGEIFFGLGCTKFSAELQQEIPVFEFLWTDDVSWPLCPSCGGIGCWRYLDSRIIRSVLQRGFMGCCHGKIEHHHDYPIDNGDEAIEIGQVFLGTDTKISGEFRKIA